MNTRTALFPLLLGAALVSTSAHSHPEGHGEEDKPFASTCLQLANPQRYEVDTAYPEIKALKARCDAEKNATPTKRKKAASAKTKSDH